MRLVWGAPGAELCGKRGSRSRTFRKEIIRGCKFGPVAIFVVRGKCIFCGLKFECLAGSLILSRVKDN